MGLFEKAKTALVRREVKRYLDRAQAWVAEQRRTPMVFWKALGVAFLAGAAAAASDAVMNGFTLDEHGLIRLCTSALSGGLIAAASYLKQSPIKPKDQQEPGK